MRIEEGGHEYSHLHLAIDIRQIYDDFVDFLQKESTNAPSQILQVEDGISFDEQVNEELKQEFEEISRL